jgi:hypothetical protein
MLSAQSNDPHVPGTKLDKQKPRMGLMFCDFAKALTAVAEVTTFGAEKYTAHGWLTVPNGQERYKSALLRHLVQEASGELRDSESQLLHAAHAAWNALACLELLITAQAREPSLPTLAKDTIGGPQPEVSPSRGEHERSKL